MKPVISDAELKKFVDDSDDYSGRLCQCESCTAKIKEALAAFLLARVPDAKPVDFHKPGMDPLLSGGEWNACREQVLQGRGDKT
jgi:hypothetical protein